jgi:LytR cell envelope-related transcriptional attenuator
MSDRYEERGPRRPAPASGGLGGLGIPTHWMLLGLAVAATLIAILVSGGGDGKSSAATPTTTSTTATSTTATAPAASTPTLSRSGISITFLNGSGIKGLAGSTAAAAKALGYTKTATGNAATQSTSSYVAYRKGSLRAAQQVADDAGILETPRPESQVPDLVATLAQTPVVVVIGTEGTSLATGSATSTTSNTPASPASPTPTPAPSATPSPSPSTTTESTTQVTPAPDLTTTTPPLPDPTSTQ